MLLPLGRSLQCTGCSSHLNSPSGTVWKIQNHPHSIEQEPSACTWLTMRDFRPSWAFLLLHRRATKSEPEKRKIYKWLELCRAEREDFSWELQLKLLPLVLSSSFPAVHLCAAPVWILGWFSLGTGLWRAGMKLHRRFRLEKPSETASPTLPQPCQVSPVPKCHLHRAFKPLQGWGLHPAPLQKGPTRVEPKPWLCPQTPARVWRCCTPWKYHTH